MFVTSSAIQNGAFEDKYGNAAHNLAQMVCQPTLSRLKFMMHLKALNPLQLS